jgi:hypothetical protein
LSQILRADVDLVGLGHGCFSLPLPEYRLSRPRQGESENCDDAYEGVVCHACGRLHLVNPKSDDKLSAYKLSALLIGGFFYAGFDCLDATWRANRIEMRRCGASSASCFQRKNLTKIGSVQSGRTGEAFYQGCCEARSAAHGLFHCGGLSAGRAFCSGGGLAAASADSNFYTTRVFGRMARHRSGRRSVAKHGG